MDDPVAEDRGDDAHHAEDYDPGVHADPGVDRGHRFAAEDEVGGEEAGVHDHHDENDQQGAEGAELPPRLDHLGDAQLRPLGGMQGHEDAADEVAEDDPDDGGGEVEPEDSGGESAGHDRHDHDVGAEPDGEQVAGLAVPFVQRDGLDGLVLQPGHLLDGLRADCGAHDALRAASDSSLVSSRLPFTIRPSRSKTRVAAATEVMSAWS